MIIVKIYGGLGNQLFQYALARQLSVCQQGLEVKLDISHCTRNTSRAYLLNFLDVHLATTESSDIEDIHRTSFLDFLKDRSINKAVDFLRGRPCKYEEKALFHFDASVFVAKDAILIGYWQNLNYFRGCASLLQKELSQAMKTLQTKLDTVQLKQPALGIHIRRGDYAKDPKTNAFHGLCPISYYRKAYQHVVRRYPDINTFVFSDDTEWVTQNFDLGDSPLEIVQSLPNDTLRDFIALSQCDHQIIANSTFSWWAAWMNQNSNKIVVAPKQWMSHQNFSLNDFFPKNWQLF